MAEWKTERSKQIWTGVAERLKLTRHLLNITEAEAAAAMFITVKTYRKWERGEHHRDNVDGVIHFAKKYGFSYGWLFAGDGYCYPPPRFKLRLVS
jgi:transcriptional regulator with XRE-family HTH domain